MTNYVLRANRLLTGKCGSRNDPNGVIKNIGIELTEILIQNRKTRDGVPGYQYIQRFMLTAAMLDQINMELINDYSSFTHDPTTTPP